MLTENDSNGGSFIYNINGTTSSWGWIFICLICPAQQLANSSLRNSTSEPTLRKIFYLIDDYYHDIRWISGNRRLLPDGQVQGRHCRHQGVAVRQKKGYQQVGTDLKMQIFIVTYLYPHIVPLLPFRSVTTTAWSASPGLFDLVSNGQALEALIIFALFGLMAIYISYSLLYI